MMDRESNPSDACAATTAIPPQNRGPDRETDAVGIELSVIAPCFQEQDNVHALVDRVLSVFDSLSLTAELVLVDDGSGDETSARIDECAAGDVRVRGVRHQRNQGIVAAWRSGLRAARGGLVCLIDADLQNRPEDIPRLLACQRSSGAAIAQAVRHSVGSGERLHLFTRGLNLLLNTAFGTRLRDGKSGFILCSRVVLADILRHRFRYRYFQSFIGAAAAVRGHAIAEVDTTFDARSRGRSFLPRFPIRATLVILWELAKFRWESWMEVREQSRGGARLLVEKNRTHADVAGVVIGSGSEATAGQPQGSGVTCGLSSKQ